MSNAAVKCQPMIGDRLALPYACARTAAEARHSHVRVFRPAIGSRARFVAHAGHGLSRGPQRQSLILATPLAQTPRIGSVGLLEAQ
jgi:hypothetical protein